MILLIGVGLAVVYSADIPPSWGCGTNPGPGDEAELTAYRALAFSAAGVIAIAVGLMAAGWSRDRRVRRGADGRPGWPTILAASLPILLLALVLLVPDAEILYAYFLVAALGGIGVVPALVIAGVVIVAAAERWRSPRARANIEAATIVIADGLIVFGLPLAVTAAYLAGGEALFC